MVHLKRANFWLMIMIEGTLVDKLKEFMECEGRSCSFDPGLITPEYVYRMWGCQVTLEEIESVWPIDSKDLC